MLQTKPDRFLEFFYCFWQEEKEKAKAQKAEVVTQMTEVLESELQCIICSELFIEVGPLTLEICSWPNSIQFYLHYMAPVTMGNHSLLFTAFRINKWGKGKKTAYDANVYNKNNVQIMK